MKAFDPNYKLLDEMYQDDYYPAFLVDKVKDELQKVIDLLESGETDTEAVQESPAPLRHQKKRGVWMKNLGFCSQARVPAPFLRTLIVYPPFVLKS